MILREMFHLGDFGLGDFLGKYASDSHSVIVYVKHSTHGLRLGLVKDGSQHGDHEIASGIVVVV